jgi:hypothetical protein
VEIVTRSRPTLDTPISDHFEKSIQMNGLLRRYRGTALALDRRREGLMELVAQVATAVGGMALAVGASRLVLEGVLAMTFGRKRG